MGGSQRASSRDGSNQTPDVPEGDPSLAQRRCEGRRTAATLVRAARCLGLVLPRGDNHLAGVRVEEQPLNAGDLLPGTELVRWWSALVPAVSPGKFVLHDVGTFYSTRVEPELNRRVRG